jgi:hypothetical protein
LCVRFRGWESVTFQAGRDQSRRHARSERWARELKGRWMEGSERSRGVNEVFFVFTFWGGGGGCVANVTERRERAHQPVGIVLRLQRNAFPVSHTALSEDSGLPLSAKGGRQMRNFTAFDLPEAVVRAVLVDWLQLKHIAQLDSVMCVKCMRPEFLMTAYGTGVTYNNELMRQCEPGIDWCLRKGVQLGGIAVSQEHLNEEAPRVSYIAKHGNMFRWVWIEETFECPIADPRKLLTMIGNHCINVQHLTIFSHGARLGNNHWDEAVLSLVRACQHLFHLLLIDLPLTTHGLSCILSQPTRLAHLQVRSRSELPAEVAIPTLVTLDISVSKVPEAVLIAVGRNCPKLYRLYMFWETNVTDAGVQAVLHGCPLLWDTDVQDARGISRNFRTELTRRNTVMRQVLSGQP